MTVGVGRADAAEVAHPGAYLDPWLATLDEDGSVRWAVGAAGEGVDGAFDGGVAVAADGSVWWTQDYASTVFTLAPDTPQAAQLPPGDGSAGGGALEAFLAHYSADGLLLGWAAATGPGAERGLAIDGVGDGAVWLVTHLGSQETLTDPSGSTALPPSQGASLVRYDARTTRVWSAGLGSATPTATTATASAILFGGTSVFPDKELYDAAGAAALRTGPGPNGVAWYDVEGTPRGSRSWNTVVLNGLAAQGTSLGAAGRLYRTGEFEGIPFDSGPDAYDAWVGTFDLEGSLRCWWQIGYAESVATDGLPQPEAVAFDGEGGLWVAGNYHAGVTFDPGLPTEFTWGEHAASWDSYLVRFSPSDR